MKRFFVLILVAVTLSLAGISVLSAGRRPPTEQEMESFDAPLAEWLKDNWAKKINIGDTKLFRKITDITFCCIDEINGVIVYIVDITFSERLYDRLVKQDEAEGATQRVLFVMNEGKIYQAERMAALGTCHVP